VQRDLPESRFDDHNLGWLSWSIKLDQWTQRTYAFFFLMTRITRTIIFLILLVFGSVCRSSTASLRLHCKRSENVISFVRRHPHRRWPTLRLIHVGNLASSWRYISEYSETSI
jgi:hypothetical protein